MRKRGHEKYIVNKAFTERYKLSAIPYMQRLLNESEKKKQEILRQIDDLSVPVNYGLIVKPHH